MTGDKYGATAAPDTEARGSEGAAASLHEQLLPAEEPPSCARALSADWAWARDESHIMIVQYCYQRGFGRLARDEQRAHWSVRCNPLYWLLFAGCLPCMLSGKWVHSLWGQGGPVRDDEVRASRERRAGPLPPGNPA